MPRVVLRHMLSLWWMLEDTNFISVGWDWRHWRPHVRWEIVLGFPLVPVHTAVAVSSLPVSLRYL